MPVHALQMYEDYRDQHMLPLQRIDLQLSRIAWLLDCIRLPGAPLQLSSYLIGAQPEATTPASQKAPPAAATEEEANAIAQALGFQPKNRRKQRPPPDQSPT